MTRTLTKTERKVCEQTYADVEKLIAKTCWQFAKRFGGDVEELIADANTHFMRAYMAASFDSSKSKFSTWVRTIVWRGLISDARHNRRHRVEMDLDLLEGACERPTIDALFEDISEDARIVVALAIQTPDALYDVAMARGGCPRNFRGAIRDYLEGLRWTAERITESFAEIKDALR